MPFRIYISHTRRDAGVVLLGSENAEIEMPVKSGTNIPWERSVNFVDPAGLIKSRCFSWLAKSSAVTTAVRANVLITVLTCLVAVAWGQAPTTIDYPGAQYTSALGINNSGQIVGESLLVGGFLYEGGAFSLIDAPAGYFTFSASGIGDGGQIVGILLTTNGEELGYLDNGGTFTMITDPGASGSVTTGISSNGTFIVGKDGGLLFQVCCEGFLDTGGVFTQIHNPSFYSTVASGVNNSGQIVGTVGPGEGGTVPGNHGFIYNGGVFTLLDFPGATSTYASGINNNGTIVGSYTDGASKIHGLIYNSGIFTSFDFPGATYTSINGINDNGVIVGSYGDAGGNQHGFFYAIGVQGYINPKYTIVGITYAPPGSQSSVTYTNSTLVGNSTTVKSSFTDQTSLSVSVSVSGQIPGFAKGSATGTYTNTYGQTSSTTNMVTINKSTQVSDKTPGPSDSFAGLNHDFDIIWLWLNPVLPFSFLQINPQAITWNGYGYDANDQPGLDIFPVYVGWLNGDIPVPGDVSQVLARTWASGDVWGPGQGPGLTGPGPDTDFAAIVQADPFWQCTQVPAQCPASADLTRFTLSDNQNIAYVQAPPGGQPITQTYQFQYQNTSQQGQGTSSTQQQAFSVDVSLSGGLFWSQISADLKDSQMLTWTTSVDTSITNTTTSTSLASITGPTCTVSNGGCNPQYTGPTEFEIYQDNQYGTFMLFPVAGTGVTDTISGKVTLNSAGLSGVTVTLSGGQSGLTTTDSSGNYTFSGLLGNANYTVTPTLTGYTFSPPSLTFTGLDTNQTANFAAAPGTPSFTISANPPAVVISAPGQSASTILTFTSVNGFTGSGNLVSSTCGTSSTEEITCTLSAFSLPANGTATATLTFASTAASGTQLNAGGPFKGLSAQDWHGLSSLALGSLLSLTVFAFSLRLKHRQWNPAPGVLLMALVMTVASCGGGGGGRSGGVSNSGTPVGPVEPLSVSITVNGTTQIVPNLTVTVQ